MARMGDAPEARRAHRIGAGRRSRPRPGVHVSRVRARRLLLVLLAVVMAAPSGALGGNPTRGDRTPDVRRLSSHPAPAPASEPAPRGLMVAYRSGTTGVARAAIRAGHGLTLVRSLRRVNTDLVAARG